MLPALADHLSNAKSILLRNPDRLSEILDRLDPDNIDVIVSIISDSILDKMVNCGFLAVERTEESEKPGCPMLTSANYPIFFTHYSHLFLVVHAVQWQEFKAHHFNGNMGNAAI